jgi:peroxiredoxin
LKERSVFATLRLLAGLTGLVLYLLPQTTADDTLPQYRFQPGQELTFHSVSRSQSDGYSHEQETDWTVWVLRANADGSFRLVARERPTASRWTSNNQTGEHPLLPPRIVYADVFPDGRVLMNNTIQYHGSPSGLFPQLPRTDTEAKSGWQSRQYDETTSFKALPSAATFVFESTTESPRNLITFRRTGTTTATFDRVQGFIAKATIEGNQAYSDKQRITSTTELRSVRLLDPAALKAIADDAERYFSAVGAYDEVTDAAESVKPADAKDMLAKAIDRLTAALASLTTAAFRDDLSGKVARHKETAANCLELAERRARVVDQPAADFEATDLAGKKVRLSDLRGRVVVLDFWCRDVDWCIRAMPQMNQLVDDFAGQPVSILGLSIDPQFEDAKFVAETLALKFPTFRVGSVEASSALVEKYGLPGFPTVIVIDPQGTVRQMYGGHTSTMRDDVGKVIRDLLPKK